MGKNSKERSRADEEGFRLSDVQNKSVEAADRFTSSNETTSNNRDVVLDKAMKNENTNDSRNSSYVTAFEKEMMPDEVAERNPTDIRSESDRMSRMKENDVREIDERGGQTLLDERFRQEQETRIRNSKISEKRDSIMETKEAQRAIYARQRARAAARAAAHERAKAAQEREKASQIDRR